MELTTNLSHPECVNCNSLRKTSLFNVAVCIIFFLFISNALEAQDRFLPGSVTLPDGNRKEGFIAFLDWDKNPGSVQFRSVENGKTTTYKPGVIEGFSVNNEHYQSALVKTETSPRDVDAMKYDPEFHFDTVRVFVKALVHGEKSLFKYKDQLGKENYYIGEKDDLKLLEYKRYLKSTSGKRVIARQNAHVSQLNAYLGNCPDIHLKLPDTEYDEKDLKGLFTYYYKCTNTEPGYVLSKEKVKLDFGILAGGSSTSLNFKGDIMEDLVEADFSDSKAFTGGVFFDLIIPRTRQRWSVVNELLYSAYQVSAFVRDEEAPDRFTETTTDFDYAYLQLNTMVRYTLPVGKIALFGNAGFMNAFALNDERTQKTFIKTPFQERTEEDVPLENSRTYEQAFLVGLGVRYGMGSLEFSFLKGNGMSDITELKSSTQRLVLLAGFRF